MESNQKIDKLIVFDSNILIGDPRLERAFWQLINGQNWTIGLPRIVLQETIPTLTANYRRKQKTLRDNLSRVFTGYRQLKDNPFACPLLEHNERMLNDAFQLLGALEIKWPNSSEVEKGFLSQLSAMTKCQVIVLEYPDQVLENTIARCIDQRRPFQLCPEEKRRREERQKQKDKLKEETDIHRSDEGWRDTIVWLTTLAACKAYPTARVVLLTADGGFSDGHSALHQHLIDDLQNENIELQRCILQRSIESFESDVLYPNLTPLEDRTEVPHWINLDNTDFIEQLERYGEYIQQRIEERCELSFLLGLRNHIRLSSLPRPSRLNIYDVINAEKFVEAINQGRLTTLKGVWFGLIDLEYRTEAELLETAFYHRESLWAKSPKHSHDVVISSRQKKLALVKAVLVLDLRSKLVTQFSIYNVEIEETVQGVLIVHRLSADDYEYLMAFHAQTDTGDSTESYFRKIRSRSDLEEALGIFQINHEQVATLKPNDAIDFELNWVPYKNLALAGLTQSHSDEDGSE